MSALLQLFAMDKYLIRNASQTQKVKKTLHYCFFNYNLVKFNLKSVKGYIEWNKCLNYYNKFICSHCLVQCLSIQQQQ